MGVAAGAAGVRQGHAVEPAVDDAVAGLEGHAAALGDELRQGVVGNNINRLRVRRGMAEGLHDKRSGELQARKILELVAGHGSGGVL